jgi:hypothetical protein
VEGNLSDPLKLGSGLRADRRGKIVHAVRENLAHLKAHGSTVGIRDRMASFERYFAAVDLDRYLAMERDLLQPFVSRRLELIRVIRRRRIPAL